MMPRFGQVEWVYVRGVLTAFVWTGDTWRSAEGEELWWIVW